MVSLPRQYTIKNMMVEEQNFSVTEKQVTAIALIFLLSAVMPYLPARIRISVMNHRDRYL